MWTSTSCLPLILYCASISSSACLPRAPRRWRRRLHPCYPRSCNLPPTGRSSTSCTRHCLTSTSHQRILDEPYLAPPQIDKRGRQPLTRGTGGRAPPAPAGTLAPPCRTGNELAPPAEHYKVIFFFGSWCVHAPDWFRVDSFFLYSTSPRFQFNLPALLSGSYINWRYQSRFGFLPYFLHVWEKGFPWQFCYALSFWQFVLASLVLLLVNRL